jgi:methionine-rich copper-binding protein CopC
MKKFFIAFGLLGIVLLVSGGAYVAYTAVKAKEETKAETATSLPSSFTNPFAEKPTSGFSSANTTTVVSGLFAEPTPTPYQNPFGSTSSAGQAYQNPFETLK